MHTETQSVVLTGWSCQKWRIILWSLVYVARRKHPPKVERRCQSTLHHNNLWPGFLMLSVPFWGELKITSHLHPIASVSEKFYYTTTVYSAKHVYSQTTLLSCKCQTVLYKWVAGKCNDNLQWTKESEILEVQLLPLMSPSDEHNQSDKDKNGKWHLIFNLGK